MLHYCSTHSNSLSIQLHSQTILISKMASACIKMSPDTFPTSPKYGWLSPRLSFTGEETQNPPNKKNVDLEKNTDFLDFEFRLNDPTAMLVTADQLFSNGKLVPTTQKPLNMTSSLEDDDVIVPKVVGHHKKDLFSSPKERTSRWKELLGLKKQPCCSNNNTNDEQKGVARSLKNLLQRNNTKSTNSDSFSMRLPLLNELETVSARLSLSSSSSGGHEHDDLPRLSLDSDKLPSTSNNSSTIPPRNGRVRNVRHRSSLSSDNSSRGAQQQRSSVRKAVAAATEGNCGLTLDSPRMNSSGKIVFHSLERSSSSPSSFNGGQPRQLNKHRGGMERSYSANVRVTPVLNVPVCSLRGFPLFSKKENGVGGGGSKNDKNLSKNRST